MSWITGVFSPYVISLSDYNGMFGSSWELALVDNKSVFLIS